MDYISTFFVVLVIMSVIPTIIYSVGYLKKLSTNYNLLYMYSLMFFFVLSMLLVITANNSITFLIFWELMSIFSFLLVIYEYRNTTSLKSGILYFILTHLSGLLLMVMFALLYKYTGTINFNEISSSFDLLKANQKFCIFIFALLGFGIKSALFPLHTWLIKSHPIVPSNISPLMSGIMVKVAIYGFIKVNFMFIVDINLSFGIIVMLVGTVTAFFAIINGIAQSDIKKIIAYSSVENMGIIYSIIGLAMIFSSYKLSSLALLSITAALFHCLNHSVFKSLLFQTAGSVYYATGSKNMNELGGLHKKIKITAVCALIGTAAISAIPPLNGFASEILILKSFIISSIGISDKNIVILIILCGVILAFTTGIAIFACVKSFGITYLGKARSKKAEDVKPIPLTMNIGMIILSIYCLVLGILAPLITKQIFNVSENTLLFLKLLDGDKKTNYLKAITKLNISFPQYEILTLTAIFVSITVILMIIKKIFGKEKNIEHSDTWSCGFNDSKPYFQYSGSSYYQPITKLTGRLTLYKKTSKIDSSISLKEKTDDLIEKHFYTAIVNITKSISNKIIKMHYGKIQLYIFYIFFTLLITIFAVFNFV